MSENQHLSDMTAIDLALKYKDFKWAKKLHRETLIIDNDKKKTARVLKDIPQNDNVAYFTSCGLYPVERAIENLPIVHLLKTSPKAGEIVEYREMLEYEQGVILDYITIYDNIVRLYPYLKKLGYLP